MSAAPNSDPRIDQAAVTDESLMVAHEKLLGKQPDDKGHYRLMPLTLLFMFSGLIFFAGTYLGLFGGKFDPHIYNEHAHPGGAVAAALPPPPVEVGKKIYATTCATCHQATGLGQPGVIPPLAGSEWVVGSEERLIRAVVFGLQGKITVKGTTIENGSMPPNGKVPGSGFNLPDDRIAAILSYIRQEWGNQAGPITAERVAEIRGKEGDHKQFSPDELLKLP
jgi:mono/diheme cytochrome c family protein